MGRPVRRAAAFSPAHITGLFEPLDGAEDPLRKGSRGAGISMELGVTTEVLARRSAEPSIVVMVNGLPAEEARVSEAVAQLFLARAGEPYEVVIHHALSVPIGCGLGASGAAALSLALALNEALELGLSREEAAGLAHVAEVRCRTGLGTVIGELVGGFEIRVKPGAPGIGEVKKIPLADEYSVVCLCLEPIPTPRILNDDELKARLRSLGGHLLDRLLEQPTVQAFMALSREFAEGSGLIPDRVRPILREADGKGIPCSLAMLGGTVFSVVEEERREEVEVFLRGWMAPDGRVLAAPVDREGARLL